MKSDYFKQLQMQNLTESIVKSNNVIAQLEKKVEDLSKELSTQRTVCEQALVDNGAKSSFNDAISALEKFNPKDLISVSVSQQEVIDALAKLQELRTKINKTNISVDQQNAKLSKLVEQYNEEVKQLNNEKDLRTSFQLQLKVAIEKQKQEIASAEALLSAISTHSTKTEQCNNLVATEVKETSTGDGIGVERYCDVHITSSTN